jgi:tetratricopeptide (TPR) repeat protein
MKHLLQFTITTLLFTGVGPLFASGGEELLARTAKDDGDYRRSVPQYQKAKQKQQLSDNGELELLQSYIVLERFEDAVALMTELEARMAHRPDYIELRGDCFVMLGDHELALRAYQSAVELDPENPDLYLKLGQLHSLLGDSESSEMSFDAYDQLWQVNN